MPSFATIITVMSSLFAATWALPQNQNVDAHSSSSGNGGSCASHMATACCSTSSNGISLLDNIVGGSCIVPNLISISNTCPGQNVYCCPTTHSGALDLSASCIPIQA